MPVDTTALFRIPVIDLPVAQVAEVVEVEWDRGYQVKAKTAKFARYWRAVQSPRYSAKEVVLLDLSGIEAGRPNFDVLKSLIKSKYQIWLDLGVRDIEDVFDCFAMDVSRAIIGTMTAAIPFTFRNVSVCVTVVVSSGPAASSNTLR
jgi:phosphoribosylformimino-5-aminoimidazole carboxamide ribonucleotide (ProFAR) isomerase